MRNTDLDALLAANGGPTGPRVLIIDIETTPHLAYTYSLWNTTIAPDMVVEPSRILCFAAKWAGEKKVHYHAAHIDGETEMVKAAWRYLNEADLVVTYNGPGFDEKHLRREFLLHGLTPPRPWKSIDLLRTVRSSFKFPSNRLGQIGDNLGIGTKVDIGGWKLWAPVLAGDEKALRLMRKYNIQDVILTEALLNILGPWVKGLPHRGLYTGNLTGCYACGSDNLEDNGLARTGVTVYQGKFCLDCGAHNKVLRNGQTRAAA